MLQLQHLFLLVRDLFVRHTLRQHCLQCGRQPLRAQIVQMVGVIEIFISDAIGLYHEVEKLEREREALQHLVICFLELRVEIPVIALRHWEDEEDELDAALLAPDAERLQQADVLPIGRYILQRLVVRLDAEPACAVTLLRRDVFPRLLPVAPETAAESHALPSTVPIILSMRIKELINGLLMQPRHVVDERAVEALRRRCEKARMMHRRR